MIKCTCVSEKFFDIKCACAEYHSKFHEQISQNTSQVKVLINPFVSVGTDKITSTSYVHFEVWYTFQLKLQVNCIISPCEKIIWKPFLFHIKYYYVWLLSNSHTLKCVVSMQDTCSSFLRKQIILKNKIWSITDLFPWVCSSKIKTKSTSEVDLRIDVS